MDAQAALEALKLFNEKAAKLEGLSFTEKIFSERSGVTLHYKQGQGLWSELHGPDEEAREAMILTLRFFVQDNERSSFRSMAEAYDALPVDTSLSGQFHDIRRQVNEFLDSKTWIRVNEDDLTNREVFDVFLYGYHAHANKTKKEKFDAWASVPPFFGLVENEFIHILATLLRAIFYIRDINTRAIEALSRAPAAGSS
jgi:hypothetical protein